MTRTNGSIVSNGGRSSDGRDDALTNAPSAITSQGNTTDDLLLLDPDTSNFILCVGKKGSGKSILAEHLFLQYPYDRLVIDPTRDLYTKRDQVRRECRVLRDPVPQHFPRMRVEGSGDKRASYIYCPNFRSSEDPRAAERSAIIGMDKVAGLAYDHGRCLLWVDEIGKLTKWNSIPPNMSTVLEQGRHRDLTVIFCGPRPVTIDRRVIQQADIIYVFRLSNKADREAIADNIGVERMEFEAAYRELGQYECIRIDDRLDHDDEDRLLILPPLTNVQPDRRAQPS
jgi:hypothetical protein